MSQQKFNIDDLFPKFENIPVQQAPAEEPGFWEKAWNTGGAIVEGIGMIPGGLVDTVRDAWSGGDIDVTDTEAMQARQAREQELAAYRQKYQGNTFEGVTDAMLSLPYSLVTMAAGLGGLAAGTAVGGPIAGGAASMGASGTMAYRASKQDFMERMLDQTAQVLGRMPTQEEWDRVATEFDSEATQYGLWEAGPEALSNLFMAKLLGPLGKSVFKGGVGNAVKRVGGLYGEELATETVTQMGQGHAEAQAGLREEMPGLVESFKEIAPATLWQTTLMAGGKKVGDIAYNRWKDRGQNQEQVPVEGQGTTHAPNAENAAPFDNLSMPEWNAPDMATEAWNSEAERRGWDHLRAEGGTSATPPAARPSETAHVDGTGTKAEVAQQDFIPKTNEYTVGDYTIEITHDDKGNTATAYRTREDGSQYIVASDWSLSPKTDAEMLQGLGFSTTQTENTSKIDTVLNSGKAVDLLQGLEGAGPVNSAPTVQTVQMPIQQTATQPAPVQPAAPFMGVGGFTPQGMVRPNVTPQLSSNNAPFMDVDALTPQGMTRPQVTPQLSSNNAPFMDTGSFTPQAMVNPQVTPALPGMIQGIGMQPAPAPVQQAPTQPAQPASPFMDASGFTPQGMTRPEMTRQLDTNNAPFMETGSFTPQGMMQPEVTPALPGMIQGIGMQPAPDSMSQQPAFMPAPTPVQQVEPARQEDQPKQKPSDPFGTAHTEFSGKPVEAIEHLLKVKQGHVPAAFYKEGLGDIDLPWGKGGKNGFGLAHIIERRNEQGLDGVAFAKRLPEIIKNGTIEKRDGFTDRAYVIAKEGEAEAVIRLNWDSSKRTWLATAYIYNNRLETSAGPQTYSQTRGDEQRIPSPRSSGAEKNVPSQSGAVKAENTDSPLVDHFAERLLSGHKYDSIVEARKEAAEILGKRVPAGSAIAKEVDEAIELGIVMASRETIRNMRADGATDEDIYRRLVDLYQRQPTLGTRTSTSVAQQAYSTPSPIAFLASRLAGITEQSKVYEPTAGNGMLLMEASTENAQANELNAGRAERLRSLGFEVTEENAVSFLPDGKMDVVIANPPFGHVRGDDGQNMMLEANGLRTSELDQAIVAQSLQSLKGNGKGRAVLIIGGKKGAGERARAAKYRTANQVNFYRHLYENYRVLSHVAVDGKLYSRQGASYPIDILVLDTNGNSEGRPYPGGQPPRLYQSFEELEGLFHEEMGGTEQPADTGDAERHDVSGDNRGAQGTSGTELQADDAGGNRRPQRSGRSGDPAADNGGNATDNDVVELQHVDEGLERDSATGRGGDSGPADGRLDSVGKDPDSGRRPDAGPVRSRSGKPSGASKGRGRAESGQRNSAGVDNSTDNVPRDVRVAPEPSLKPAPKPKDTEFQTAYAPKSKASYMGTLIPKGMAEAAQNSLNRLEEEHGNLDEYVARELGYTPAEVESYFGAEQIDAIALAIHHMRNGGGFIIGDQTGIGKGRVNAAIIRWTRQQNKIPVFITIKNDLYADMVRDLADIGMEGFNPLVTNGGLAGESAIILPDGRSITTKGAKIHQQELNEVARNGLGDYDAVFTTYAQIQRQASLGRRGFLESLAPNAVFILDEAHSAGGTNENGRSKPAGTVPSIGDFIRDLLKKCPNGTFYSSATYAKRPDVMSLYLKTNMRFAVNDIKSLGMAISEGGIPMQQVVATMLTQDGQYLRRERSYEGAETEVETVKADKKLADESAAIMRAIQAFNLSKEEDISKMKDRLAATGKTGHDNQSANAEAVQSGNFSSVMHNLIAQSLMAQKVDALVDSVAKSVEQGLKPVIALNNTMESMIEEFARMNGLKVGDDIDLTFKDLFRRYLRKAREVTIKKPGEKKSKDTETRLLEDRELSEASRRRYAQALDMIDNSRMDAFPISFIDSIKDGLRRRGISVEEITGRTMSIDYSGVTPKLATREKQSNIKTVNDFNSGKTDVVILNSSGSTGISLHASERFQDQRRRIMYIAQAAPDINVFMQTLGRVFRTGQVVPPQYKLLFTDLPAERRAAALLAMKMASLNANTTAAKDSATSFQGIPDFINKYGDKVANTVAQMQPEMVMRMGVAVDNQDGDMRKLTGYIPLLNVDEQAQIYDLLTAEYNDYIEQVKSTGDYDLEATTLELDAKLVEESTLAQAKDSSGISTPFAAEAKLGTYSVKKLGKPLRPEQVKELLAKGEDIDTDDLRQKALDYLETQREGYKDPEAFDRYREKQNDIYRQILNVANTLEKGNIVNVGTKTSDLLGMVVNVYNDGRSKSPLALSSWKADIAVNDASQKVTVSFSQVVNGETSGDLSITPTYGRQDNFYRILESGQADTRETRQIVTGNLLAGKEVLQGTKGRVVFFKDEHGVTHPGIMLPLGHSAANVMANADVSLLPDQAIAFLKAVGNMAAVKTQDKNFIVSQDRSGGYSINTPASKAKGGQYFLNKGILDAADGQEFVKAGSNMVMRGVKESTLRKILLAMNEQGTGFVADNNRDAARSVVEGKPLASLAGENLPPRREGRRPPYIKAVRRIASKLNERAENAARAEVVEKVSDLPEHLRNSFASERVEGLYDPTTATVWIVNENLDSIERAAEVWAHETLVHHGLRSLFKPHERRILLSNLFLKLGGMGNARIREVSRLYGVDPRNDAANRILVMEELLAQTAERRAQNLLDTQGNSIWRNIVNAVTRWWNTVIERVTGRSGRMDMSHMERLLDTLQGHVLDGKPVDTAEFLTEEESALASLDDNSREQAKQAWYQLQEDMANWGRQVDEFDPAAFGTSGQRKLLTVCQTPDVLRKLGAPDLPMTMMANNLGKVLSSKQDHNLPKSVVKQLPAALAEPIMVFESATQPDAFVVMTELKHGGRSIMVAVHLNTERQNLQVNDIASAYRRGSEGWYIRQIEDGRLLYQDKKKSLAWARTNRLQLPKVRKLPARLSESSERARTNRLQLPQVRRLPSGLSEGRILTEADIVKPIAPLDAPLASLADTASAAARGLRGIIRRGVDKDVQEIMDDPEMGKLVSKKDMGFLERVFTLPHYMAKKFKEFEPIYRRQQDRAHERNSAVKKATETVPLLFDPDSKNRLKAKEVDQLAKMIWEWDGKEIGPLHGINKFRVKETLDNGREILEMNPRYVEKQKEWLNTQPQPARVKEAFAQVRQVLDDSFLSTHNRMAHMSDIDDGIIQQYRTEIGSVQNYFPHKREGKYAAIAKVDGKETVYRQHFDVPLGSSVREEWAKIVAANRKGFPGAKWELVENQKLPEDVLGAPVDVEAMEQIILAATKKLGDGEQTEQVRQIMLGSVSDILKSRGFGAHAIHRTGIPGFKKDDIAATLYDYISGLHGWMTKMDAARDFTESLGKIDATSKPELWSYTQQYVQDMLRNSDKIDRWAGNVKSLAFAWYLGGNIKTAVVNLTQNLTVGVPLLQSYVTGGAQAWMRAAYNTIGLSYTGKGLAAARGITDDERAMLDKLYGEGVITDAYMEELRGQVSRSPVLKTWSKFTALLGKPMSVIEHFNRGSLALAAYRAARAGQWSERATREFGYRPGQKATHEQAMAFASHLVSDAHYEYGRGNMPEAFRSGTVGRVISPAYTFRSFSANTLNLWWHSLRYGGKEGRWFVAKNLGANLALGGLTAFPFYATMSALCTAMTGDDEDWTAHVRKLLPESNLVRDLVCYGVPSLAGVNLGGSMRMETPFTDGLQRGTTFKEAMDESILGLMGIPYDLFIEKPSKVAENLKYGQEWKAVETLVPTFISNAMQAYRLATEGQTGKKGAPINSPGQEGARKLSLPEALGKAAGFQPLSSSKSYDAYLARKRMDDARSAKLNELVLMELKARDTGDRMYRIQMMKELRAWNKRMEEEGKESMKIPTKSINRSAAQRRRQGSKSPTQLQKGAEQKALWGI